MNIVLLTAIILHSISVAFMGLCLIRLFNFSRRHRLQENNFTLLFGFISMQQMMLAYLVTVGIFVFGSMIIILSLMNT